MGLRENLKNRSEDDSYSAILGISVEGDGEAESNIHRSFGTPDNTPTWRERDTELSASPNTRTEPRYDSNDSAKPFVPAHHNTDLYPLADAVLLIVFP